MKRVYLVTALFAAFVLAIPANLIAATSTHTPTPTPTKAVTATADETLTKTEQIASRTVVQDITAIESEMQWFQEEIIKNHPGYHYNFQTGRLDHDTPALVKIEPKTEPKADAKPVPVDKPADRTTEKK